MKHFINMAATSSGDSIPFYGFSVHLRESVTYTEAGPISPWACDFSSNYFTHPSLNLATGIWTCPCTATYHLTLCLDAALSSIGSFISINGKAILLTDCHLGITFYLYQGDQVYCGADNGKGCHKIHKCDFSLRTITSYWSVDPVLPPPRQKIIGVETLVDPGSTSNNPKFVRLMTNNSGSQGIFAYQFSYHREEELYFKVKLPTDYAINSTLTAQVDFTTQSKGTGTVIWGIEYGWSGVGGFYTKTSIITGATGVSAGNYLQHMSQVLSSISGSGDLITGRLFRSATDTYNASVIFLSLNFSYVS
jgi:hypothetical protein